MINEVLVLVFNRGDIWLFQGIFFSPKFQKNYFLAKSEAKIRRLNALVLLVPRSKRESVMT